MSAGARDVLNLALADVERLAAEQQAAHLRLLEVHRNLLSCLGEVPNLLGGAQPISNLFDDNPNLSTTTTIGVRLAVASQQKPADVNAASGNVSFLQAGQCSGSLSDRQSFSKATSPADCVLEWHDDDTQANAEHDLEVHGSERTPPGGIIGRNSSGGALANSSEGAFGLKPSCKPSGTIVVPPDFHVEKTESPLVQALEMLPHNRCTRLLRYAYDVVSQVKEPARSGILHAFVHNQKWEMVCVGVIAANVLFSAIASDYELSNLGKEPTAAMNAIELVLVCFYTLELSLKLKVHGLYLFCSEDWRWNVFDLILVLFSLSDVMVTLVLKDSGANISVMRLFRLLKLSKVLRLFRVVRFLTELRVMFHALQESTSMLFWCVLMLAFIVFAVGLVLVQGVTNHLKTNVDQMAEEDVDDIIMHFGGVRMAMLSLYMATTGGEDWGMYYRMVAQIGFPYTAIFLFYTAFFSFTLFNILTGMVVENVVKASDRDEEARTLEYRRKRRQHHYGLTKLFAQLDTDGSGKISFDEFKAGMQSENVQASMSRLGLDPFDSELFFMMLASVSEDGGVDPEAFVSGCMQLRGPAAGIDMQCLIFETRQMHEAVRDIVRSAQGDSGEDRAEEPSPPKRLSKSRTSIVMLAEPSKPETEIT